MASQPALAYPPRDWRFKLGDSSWEIQHRVKKVISQMTEDKAVMTYLWGLLTAMRFDDEAFEDRGISGSEDTSFKAKQATVCRLRYAVFKEDCFGDHRGLLLDKDEIAWTVTWLRTVASRHFLGHFISALRILDCLDMLPSDLEEVLKGVEFWRKTRL